MDAQELQILKNRYDIIGNDPALNRALETAVAIAPTDLTVLIEGESGTGKEVIPQIIHQHSRRKTGRYLAVNCGALPEGTINAELFGHEKGAFTGAVGERKGYFEEANGGTLFLDEIGELPKDTQAMLLRVLQNGEFLKVGSSKVEKTDVRVICATNVNLSYAVATGKFRQDLYYRINSIQIQMPPLRERKSDIYLLFRKFASDFAQKYGSARVTLDLDAISRLSSYRWPGNVRQLKNVAETVSALESRPAGRGVDKVELGPEVISRYLPDEQDSLLPATAAPAASGSLGDEDKKMIIKAILDLKQEVDALKHIVHSGGSLDAIAPPAAPHLEDPEEQIPSYDEPEPQPLDMKHMRDELIERALLRHGGSVALAARELGISERTIYRKLAAKKKNQ
ncbi:MAG: sigma-54-dependent Fis family transcriptional regulator [Bacteroidales bacterium]|nr:sigma-54-dependent Fis family transcriptional regulator [Bacteroidales bacterium]MBR0084061.1 sigma-54-dependent Fis family transcriptional regulator [Bacteroidales bacterium]